MSNRNDIDIYVAAKRAWNDRFGEIYGQHRIKNVIIAGQSFAIVALVAGLVTVALQNKVVPYVVSIDKLGNPVGVAVATTTAPAALRDLTTKAQIRKFLEYSRSVSTDGGLMASRIGEVRRMSGEAAWKKVSEHYGMSTPEGKDSPRNPFNIGKHSRVTVTLDSLLQLPGSDYSWQAQWTEEQRDAQSGRITRTVRYQAIIGLKEFPEQATAENPLGITVFDIDWQELSETPTAG